jgi:hypothetical protein
MKEMSKATDSTARDLRLITSANQAQSSAAARLSSLLADIRRVTERNAEGVTQTRGGTVALLNQAKALVDVMGSSAGRRLPNGRTR